MSLQPYLMFTIFGQPFQGAVWHDAIRGRDIPSTMHFDNYGFAQDFDFETVPDSDYLRRHGKQPGERLVLITGASVVQSVGATKDENTISAQLERHLNTNSAGVRYRVLNIAMGGWIAYQQFVALSLLGLPLDPDWVVVMDGLNDGDVPCVFGSGATSPMDWPKLLYLTYGGTGEASSPLATIARHSAFVRLMSGLRPETGFLYPGLVVFDDTEADPRFKIKLNGLTAAIQDRQVTFYLDAERDVISLFHRANVLLSTQALFANNTAAPSYRRAFAPGGTAFAAVEAELDHYMDEHKNDQCAPRDKLDAAGLRGYFVARSALRLAELVDATQKSDPMRHIIYRNVEGALPYEDKLREQFFIDHAHLTDLGQDRVAEFFAENILAAEHGTPFDFASFAKRSAELAAAP